MPNLDHEVHKYERVRLGDRGFKVFKCALPNCPHYLRRELVVGKLTRCWRCDRIMIMTKPAAKMKKPHCLDCTRPYNRSEAA
jgi:hypothetical protein